MKRQVRSGDKKMIGKDGDVSKELIPYRPKNQGVKRKQARVPPFQINTIVCDEQEVKHDAMALVIANPQLVQNSTQQQSRVNFDLDETLEEIGKKVKKSKVPIEDISAEAAMQPRREP